MKHLIGSLVTLCVALVGSQSASADEGLESQATRKPFHLIAIGDSISAGFLGYTQIKQQSSQKSMTMQSVDDYEEPPPPKTWLGFRYPVLGESKTRWSWVTGSETYSIAERLGEWLNSNGKQPARVRWYNLAESGALVSHMPRQVRLAFDKRKSEVNTPISLVTLMIGANDACSTLETSKAEELKLRESLRVTFQRLAQGRPAVMKQDPLRVYVSSVPNIPALGRQSIMKGTAYWGMTCEGVRASIMDTCPLMVHWKTEAEYQARVRRVRFVNDVIRTSVEAAKKQQPKLALHFDNTFNEFPLEGSLLAADCFHPGKSGQTLLADILWQGMPWFQTLSPAR